METIRNIVARELERFGVPGAGVGVVGHGDVLLQEGFGLRSIDARLPVTEETLFPIGSTTKALTATVLATFVDEGRIRWDQPVRDYFPAFRLHDPIATQEVTLRDMLSHRTGIAGHEMLMFMYGRGEMSRGELVDRLRHLPFSRGFREEFQYNNLIYMVAGYICEVITGLTWEETVAERLLQPLGMDATNFSIDELQKVDDHSRPHASRGGRTGEVPYRAIEIAGPAGSINSNVADMTRWVQMNLNEGRFADKQVVSADSLRELHKPAVVMPVDMPWEETKLVGYGLGWVVEDYRGHRVVWHNGGIDGFKSVVSLVPGQRLGVVVLANRFPSEAPETIAYRIVDELLGLDSIDWGRRRSELEIASAAAAEKQRVSRREQTKDDAPPTHPLSAFAGEYDHPGYGRISFEVMDGKLVADLHGLKVRMEHRHYNVWDAHEDAHEMVVPFVFQIGSDGDIDRVEAELEPQVDPIVFRRVTVERRQRR